MDAGYGPHIDLRTAITTLGLPYVAGILSNTAVWVRIPTKRATDSERRRPPIPIDGGQGFR
jgi:SRSO17 transposase